MVPAVCLFNDKGKRKTGRGNTVFFIIHMIAVIVEKKYPDWLGCRQSKKAMLNYGIPIMSLVFFLIAVINSPK